MQIAVIGSKGFIGHSIIKCLEKTKHNVLGYSSSDGDLRDSSNIEPLRAKIMYADAVIILSALTPKKGLSSLQLVERFMDNLRILENICIAINCTDIKKIIYVSTDAVYDKNDSILREHSVLNPDCLYGMSHKVREQCLTTMFSDRQLVILRPCALYGVNDPHNAYGPNRFIREAFEHKTISLFGEGEEIRNHIWVEDFSLIVLKFIESNFQGIYNIALDEPISFYELALLIKDSLPFKVEIKSMSRQMPIFHKIHCVDRLYAVFQDLSFTSLANGIDIMYKWLLQNKESGNIHVGS